MLLQEKLRKKLKIKIALTNLLITFRYYHSAKLMVFYVVIFSKIFFASSNIEILINSNSICSRDINVLILEIQRTDTHTYGFYIISSILTLLRGIDFFQMLLKLWVFIILWFSKTCARLQNYWPSRIRESYRWKKEVKHVIPYATRKLD